MGKKLGKKLGEKLGKIEGKMREKMGEKKGKIGKKIGEISPPDPIQNGNKRGLGGTLSNIDKHSKEKGEIHGIVPEFPVLG